MKIILAIWILFFLVLKVRSDDPENHENDYKEAVVIQVKLNNRKQIDQLLPLQQHMNVSSCIMLLIKHRVKLN